MNLSGHKPRVAFQGEHGAFSEEAALKLLGPEIELVPRPTFAALFRSLDEGDGKTWHHRIFVDCGFYVGCVRFDIRSNPV